MNILLLGAAGFIGTNLTKQLAKNADNQITAVDICEKYFEDIRELKCQNVCMKEFTMDANGDFDSIIAGHEVVYHLVSTTVPTTSNQKIAEELYANVVFSVNLLESCVRCGVKKIIFISSGGTVYGKSQECPLKEDMPTNPISAYGIQKVTIEKLLYLYHHMHGLDYRVVRLANPYGPYQRPNGILGAVTTFTYKALRNEEIVVYGDGTVIRDFIYIEDAISAIITIAGGISEHRVFNVGSGCGTSINDVLKNIRETLDVPLHIKYQDGRTVDVPVNYLDITRYEENYGKICSISLKDGIQKTALFLKEKYDIN